MSRRGKINLLIIVTISVLVLPIVKARGGSIEADILEGEFLVSFDEVDEEIIAFLEENQFKVVRRMDQINLLLVKAVGEIRAKDCAESLLSNPRARYVEPNVIVRLPTMEFIPVIGASQMMGSPQIESSTPPDDPLWASDPLTGVGQWNMRVIDADEAWRIHVGAHNTVVAILDTGVFSEHQDLDANYEPGGYDWVNVDEDPHDDHGHGSWVAGIIAAETGNGYGVAGLAQVLIMAEKVLDERGVGTLSDVISGLVHSADLGVDVINMSFGTYYYSEALEEAVNYAWGKGCILVASAGNEGTDTPQYPAALEKVLAVASTYGEPDDVRAPGSNHGSWIAVSAPGGWDENGDGSPGNGEHWIISTYNSQDVFAVGFGTSAAAPHVSGLAALYKSLHPNASNSEVEEALFYAADDKGAPGWDEFYGYGRINANNALKYTEISSIGGIGEITTLEGRISTRRFNPFILLSLVLIILLTARRLHKE